MFNDEDDEEDNTLALIRGDTIPQFPISMPAEPPVVDAPDNITHDSTFNEVQENDVKIINLALTVQLHALSNTRTVNGVCKLSQEIRNTINARRDALLYQKEKEPTLSGKGGVINVNPID